jgi:hypothetical protein
MKEVKMSPKEKAKELMHYYLKELLSAKYSINGFVINDLAKQCALIAVDEIILQNNVWIKQIGKGTNNYWIEVKEEIEKL